MVQARVLVIRFSSMGDVVLTTPVVRALAQQLEGGAEVHFLTKKKFASVLDGNPHIARVHTIDESVQEVMNDLKAIDFDYVIDLHNNLRSRIVKRGLKRLSFTFKKYNFEKWLWVNLGINRMPKVHVVDRYLDTLKAFQVKDDGQGLDYFIPSETICAGVEGLPQKYVAVAIGAAHIGKKMSAEHWLEVVKQMHKPVLLLGGKEDAEVAEFIQAACKNDVWNAAGKWSIHQSALALKNAEVVISGDTGLMHIASAFGKKIVSLWGCTTPGLGMSPYRAHPQSVMIEPSHLKKRPCSKLGNRCKYGEKNRCIEQIAAERVVNAVNMLWNNQ
jgi:ADP-heptose:LPS heptosyltransferase